METLTIAATARDVLGKRVKKYRLEGKTPAVLFGVTAESTPIVIDTKEFLAVYAKAGESTLIDVVLDNGTPIKTLVSEIQVHPVTSRILHVDLRRVDMNKKITASVKLQFVGESAAVKNFGGTFVAQIDEVTIECLPSQLMHEITVDISKLASFDDTITIAELSVPAGVTIENNPETIIAMVEAPRSEAELAALNEAVVADVTQVEKVEKKKKEEEPVEEKK